MLNFSNTDWLVDEDWMTSHCWDYPYSPVSSVVLDLPSAMPSSFHQLQDSDGNPLQKMLSKMSTAVEFTYCNHDRTPDPLPFA